MNANLARIIAIELMAAAEGIDFRRPLTSSEPLEEAHALVRGKAAARETDREFASDIEAVARDVEADVYALSCRIFSPPSASCHGTIWMAASRAAMTDRIETYSAAFSAFGLFGCVVQLA